jgi:membrane protein DedA with SNARE-associated domain
MQRFPSLAKEVPRVDRFVGRWHALAVILLRFAYGLRIAGPIVLGAGRMGTLTFMWANALGAAVWALLLGAIGWGFGHAAARLFGDVARAEHIALGVVIVVVVLVSVLHFAARRRQGRGGERGDK